VIDYIDAACKSWGRFTRWIRADTGEGFTRGCKLP
jgi:hypothetical protein